MLWTFHRLDGQGRGTGTRGEGVASSTPDVSGASLFRG